MTSCQDEDFGYSADQIKYEKSFTDLYGEFPADKSWDMSSYTNLYNPDKSNQSETRAGTRGNFDGVIIEGTSNHFSKKSWWEVPSQTLNWMKSALKEGKDNRYLGSNFVLQFPDNDFVIIPIFQGNSSINSELELKVNGYGIKKIWGKNDDLLVNDHFLTDAELNSLPNPASLGESDIVKYTNTTKDTKWHRLGYYAGWEYAADVDDESKNPSTRLSATKTLEEIKAMDNEYKCEMYPSSTLKAKRILSKPIYFRKDKFQFAQGDEKFMYLSLHNTGKSWASWTNYTSRWDEGSDTWTTIGHRLTSINPEGHMLALNVPSSYRPKQSELPMVQENGETPNQVIMVACEDANGSSSDHDVNDVVFLIIGYPNAPTIVPTKEVVEKRYMCEDLGGTYDFDFNDIVVDVSRTRYYKIHATPSNIDDPYVDNIHIDRMELDETKPEVQMATIAHVCGTLPIQARVGNYFFPKISDPTDQYKTRTELEGAGYLISADDGAFTRAVPQGGYGQVAKPSGWNPNKTRIITDNSWDPDKNNVRIYVEWAEDNNVEWNADHKTDSNNGNHQHQSLTYTPADETDYFADFSGKNFKTVLFPDFYGPGEKVRIPYIIATDTNVPWMKEEKCVPPAWIRGDFSAELGPLDTGDTDYSDNPADPGSCFFMEQYPAGAGEGYIWEGKITGMANTTGVAIKPGSPEMEALKEGRIKGRGYYLLNIYTEPMSGQTGRVGLSTFDSDGDWINLNSQYADGYLQYASRSEGRFTDTSLGCENWECTTIYLTEADWATIESNGLVVTSKTDGLVIRKITTSRPVILKNGSESDRAIYSNNENLLVNGSVVVDKGYTINITAPVNGSIKGSERERIADLKTPDEGASEADKASIESHNAAERNRTVVPFYTAHYTRYATVNLTAVGNKGYKFDYWQVNGSRDASRTTAVTTVECPYPVTTQAAEGSPTSITITAVFTVARDPGLSLLPKHPNNAVRTDTVLTIARGATYALKLSSGNMDKTVSTYGGNEQIVSLESSKGQYAHTVNITANAVGTTSFLIYQEDGGEYGVSEEISVKVNVVDVPNHTEVLNRDRFYQWNAYSDPNARIVGTGNITNNIGERVTNLDNGYCRVVLGSSSNDLYEYADLTRTDYLFIEMEESVDLKSARPRLFFNWTASGNASFPADDSRYCTVLNNAAASDAFNHYGTVTYMINLKEVRNRHGYYATLTNIQTDYGKTSQYTHIKSVTMDKYECPAEAAATRRTLTLACADDDYELFINGSPTSTASVFAGADVTVKAVLKSGIEREADAYRFKWSGAAVNKLRTKNDEETTFAMPDANTTVTALPVYSVQPQTCLYNAESTKDGDHKYEAKWGSEGAAIGAITVTGDGQTVDNTGAVFVPMETEVTASASVKPGYAFDKWLWGVGSNPSSATVTRTSDHKKIQYAPQAGYKKAAEEWTNLSISFADKESQKFNLNKPGDGRNAIGIKFDNTNVGTINVYIGSWDPIQSNLRVKDGYIVFKLSQENLNNISDSSKLFIQILGPAGVDLKETKIVSIYEFSL